MFFFHFLFSLCHISSLAFVWTPLSHPSSRLFFPVHSYQGFLCFCCRIEVRSCLYMHIFVIWLAGLDGQSPPQTIINITSFLHTFFSQLFTALFAESEFMFVLRETLHWDFSSFVDTFFEIWIESLFSDSDWLLYWGSSSPYWSLPSFPQTLVLAS